MGDVAPPEEPKVSALPQEREGRPISVLELARLLEPNLNVIAANAYSHYEDRFPNDDQIHQVLDRPNRIRLSQEYVDSPSGDLLVRDIEFYIVPEGVSEREDFPRFPQPYINFRYKRSADGKWEFDDSWIVKEGNISIRNITKRYYDESMRFREGIDPHFANVMLDMDIVEAELGRFIPEEGLEMPPPPNLDEPQQTRPAKGISRFAPWKRK